MQLTERQNKLLEFVKEQHGDQVRKYTGEPYWTHVYEVAEIVSKAKGECLIEIALCHDLLEDTYCTYDLLFKKLFSMGFNHNDVYVITSGVRDLSDEYTKEIYPEYNRGQRKELEADRLGRISPNAQTVKYADLISNTKSIVDHDKNFAKVYLKEKERILERMRNGDLQLLVECYNTLQEALNKLNQ